MNKAREIWIEEPTKEEYVLLTTTVDYVRKIVTVRATDGRVVTSYRLTKENDPMSITLR